MRFSTRVAAAAGTGWAHSQAPPRDGASALAVYPAASLQGAALPGGFLLVPLAAIAASAVACVVLAAGIALRADLLSALRNE